MGRSCRHRLDLFAERWFHLIYMEISGIDKLQSLKKVTPKEGVQHAARVDDTVAISSESKKRAQWVEMVKNMPDVRAEKIQAALMHTSPSPAELAQKMLESDF